ncbi:DUF2189 domain-containing protein [Pseudovibrio sp. SPO723]|uniref:DUF2189 domain-containing protein n=1 Tax=Nesiotobacter zosterae TaxID=392721 RepID=UPI0029C3098D|nr:DUF2189 domain-containing protein [Pseudovibrio sp. SPO723]MDX5592358.1 DUF2189 domain-containing protein [Pseudovibrio sp. SPO723]
MVRDHIGQATHLDDAAERQIPVVNKIEIADIVDALKLGMKDFRRQPLYGLFFGCFFAIGGNVIVLMSFFYNQSHLSYPLAVGFWLIGPFIAVGLYEVSRRLEKNEELSWRGVLGIMWDQHRRELAWMAFVVIFILLMWMFEVRLLLALFLGFSGFSTFGEFLQVMFTTPQGFMFLVVGNVVGALISLILFSLTVVSFPLLLDRNYDFITAMITSVKVVLASPVVMIGWGWAITLILLASMAPAFIGLIVTLPILGHTTWHLYRKAVRFEDKPKLN